MNPEIHPQKLSGDTLIPIPVATSANSRQNKPLNWFKIFLIFCALASTFYSVHRWIDRQVDAAFSGRHSTAFIAAAFGGRHKERWFPFGRKVEEFFL